ncbi:MAG: FG-GAP-like repeat-containing protein [Planctomycetota bacterium]
MLRVLLSWAGAGVVSFGPAAVSSAKQAGVFYSTLYAKTLEPQLIDGFAGDASHWFLRDVNGDGRDDAVAYYSVARAWRVALAGDAGLAAPRRYGGSMRDASGRVVLMGDVNGDGRHDTCRVSPRSRRWYVGVAGETRFTKPVAFGAKSPADATGFFLADVNGDGMHDAVCVVSSGGSEEWFVGLSAGDRFRAFTRWGRRPTHNADQRFLADVNGDRRADAVAFYQEAGRWSVALAAEDRFAPAQDWLLGFGGDGETAFVCDVDRDGKMDAGCHRAGTWRVAHSGGDSFRPNPRVWISGFGERDPERVRDKQNPPPVVAVLTGSISGGSSCACFVDGFGRWFAASNPSRSDTLAMEQHNTWVSWRCSYLPQTPGHEGVYDSGDPAVQDAHIKMLHDAGFTYITLDITNGRHAWVDDRAHNMFESVRRWNRRLGPGQHRMQAHVALGRTRGVEGEDAFFDKLDRECRRAWEEFYLPYKDIYYKIEGKPVVIHMISNGLKHGYYERLAKWGGGERRYIGKVACRWMTGWGGCTAERKNFYGWDVSEKFGNPVHHEMMPVMPGFWNGTSYVDREGGDFYRSQWVRVIEHQPNSVWLNSFNETWEHTSVEPAHMFNSRQPHEGITAWTDLRGERMDDFYWLMTTGYMKLFMDNTLVSGSYVQERRPDGRGYGPVFRVGARGFSRQRTPPRRAPVLLLPAGFLNSFSGRVAANVNEPPAGRAAAAGGLATGHER